MFTATRTAARRLVRLAPVLAAALGACATLPPQPADFRVAYVAADDGSAFARYAPVFLPQAPERSYNRIGTVAARLGPDGRERLYVDPASATVYVQSQRFETARGRRYTNLIYRVHFERVPLRLLPLNLGAGRNVGLIVVVTLDEARRPVLLSTVHACGCYLAFLPTSYLPDAAYPEGWPRARQTVFGERLPARLDYAPVFDANLRPLIFLRDGTHRVTDVGLGDVRRLGRGRRIVEMAIRPMSALERVPLDGRTTSFFRTRGPLKGYVKNAARPLELLLMSWWTFDPGVGLDKKLGDARETGTVFYTSLKPWHRRASDMWRFAEFLEFWGWRL